MNKIKRHIITYYSTISYGGTEGRDIEKRLFLTEKAARENAKRDSWNSDFKLYVNHVFADEEDKISVITSYIAEIVSKRNPETEYYMLFAIDEENLEHPIITRANPHDLIPVVKKIEQEPNYEYYTINKVNESLLEDGCVESYEFFSLLPSRNNPKVNYYALYGEKKYGTEEQLVGFKTLEEAQNYNLILSDDYINYNYYEVLAEFNKDDINITKNLIKQIHNQKEDIKRKGKRKK